MKLRNLVAIGLLLSALQDVNGMNMSPLQPEKSTSGSSMKAIKFPEPCYVHCNWDWSDDRDTLGWTKKHGECFVVFSDKYPREEWATQAKAKILEALRNAKNTSDVRYKSSEDDKAGNINVAEFFIEDMLRYGRKIGGRMLTLSANSCFAPNPFYIGLDYEFFDLSLRRAKILIRDEAFLDEVDAEIAKIEQKTLSDS
ncbi:hypothetical protein FACS189472_07930 [Alphaproteobacteria bacterium]|nr:hypothetical protein FACS189472_07930 [Alphaproteobacteria bacterium]